MWDTGQHYSEVLGWHVPARALIFFSKQDYDLKSVRDIFTHYIKSYIPIYARRLPCYVYLLSDDIQNLFILSAYFISTVSWVIANFITNILTFLFTFPFSELSKGIQTLYDVSADPFIRS